MTDLAGNINLLNSMQIALHFGDNLNVELKQYSDADLEGIQKWATDFIKRVLTAEYPQPEYSVESSAQADWVVCKNQEIIKYEFVSGKTDLMGQFPLTAGQILNICKLAPTADITSLYFVSSVGTSAVTPKHSTNPYGMLLNDSLGVSGRIFIRPE